MCCCCCVAVLVILLIGGGYWGTQDSDAELSEGIDVLLQIAESSPFTLIAILLISSFVIYHYRGNLFGRDYWNKKEGDNDPPPEEEQEGQCDDQVEGQPTHYH